MLSAGIDAESKEEYYEIARIAISAWMEQSRVVPLVRRD
jgi:hypothetical protein